MKTSFENFVSYHHTHKLRIQWAEAKVIYGLRFLEANDYSGNGYFAVYGLESWNILIHI